MIEYTKSAAVDTIDYIKKVIYVFDLGIQSTYILYLGYRVLSNTGIMFSNMVLLCVTIFYLLYFVVTTNEFFTIEEKRKRAIIREIVKWIKRIVHILVISVAVLQLYNSPSSNDNMTLLITFLMILGFALSVVLDVVLKIVNNRIRIIKNSFLYDANIFKKNHKHTSTIISRAISQDFDELFPQVDDRKMVDIIKGINHNVKNKSRRKRDFKLKSKKN